MGVPAAMLSLLGILSGCLFGVMMSGSDDPFKNTIVFFVTVIIYAFSVVTLMAYGEQRESEGMKNATVQCQTEDCPYYLKTQDDSTRQWVPRKKDE